MSWESHHGRTLRERIERCCLVLPTVLPRGLHCCRERPQVYIVRVGLAGLPYLVVLPLKEVCICLGARARRLDVVWIVIDPHPIEGDPIELVSGEFSGVRITRREVYSHASDGILFPVSVFLQEAWILEIKAVWGRDPVDSTGLLPAESDVGIPSGLVACVTREALYLEEVDCLAFPILDGGRECPRSLISISLFYLAVFMFFIIFHI